MVLASLVAVTLASAIFADVTAASTIDAVFTNLDDLTALRRDAAAPRDRVDDGAGGGREQRVPGDRSCRRS